MAGRSDHQAGMCVTVRLFASPGEALSPSVSQV